VQCLLQVELLEQVFWLLLMRLPLVLLDATLCNDRGALSGACCRLMYWSRCSSCCWCSCRWCCLMLPCATIEVSFWCLLQVEVLEQVFRLLRVVPRFSRQAGSSSGMLGGGGTLTDDVVLFNAERAKWRRQ
jgi:hypothetical protein